MELPKDPDWAKFRNRIQSELYNSIASWLREEGVWGTVNNTDMEHIATIATGSAFSVQTGFRNLFLQAQGRKLSHQREGAPIGLTDAGIGSGDFDD